MTLFYKNIILFVILISFILALHSEAAFKNNQQPYSGISYHLGNCLKGSLYDTHWQSNFLKFPIKMDLEKNSCDKVCSCSTSSFKDPQA